MKEVDALVPFLAVTPIVIWGVVLLAAGQAGRTPRWIGWWKRSVDLPIVRGWHAHEGVGRLYSDGMFFLHLALFLVLWAMTAARYGAIFGDIGLPIVLIASIALGIGACRYTTAWFLYALTRRGSNRMP